MGIKMKFRKMRKNDNNIITKKNIKIKINQRKNKK